MNSNGSERIKLSPLVRLSSKLSNNSIIFDSESEHGNAKIKALIVDDSSMNRKMVRRLLEMKGNDDDDNDNNGNSYNNDDDDNCYWPQLYNQPLTTNLHIKFVLFLIFYRFTTYIWSWKWIGWLWTCKKTSWW